MCTSARVSVRRRTLSLLSAVPFKARNKVCPLVDRERHTRQLTLVAAPGFFESDLRVTNLWKSYFVSPDWLTHS